MSKDRSFPAHPVNEINWNHEDARFNGVEAQHLGMTMREHYAGEALQGLLASGRYNTHIDPPAIAASAFALADAMLREGEK